MVDGTSDAALHWFIRHQAAPGYLGQLKTRSRACIRTCAAQDLSFLCRKVSHWLHHIYTLYQSVKCAYAMPRVTNRHFTPSSVLHISTHSMFYLTRREQIHTSRVRVASLKLLDERKMPFLGADHTSRGSMSRWVTSQGMVPVQRARAALGCEMDVWMSIWTLFCLLRRSHSSSSCGKVGVLYGIDIDSNGWSEALWWLK